MHKGALSSCTFPEILSTFLLVGLCLAVGQAAVAEAWPLTLAQNPAEEMENDIALWEILWQKRSVVDSHLASIDGGGRVKLGIPGQGRFLEDVSGGRVLKICLGLPYQRPGNGFYSFILFLKQ